MSNQTRSTDPALSLLGLLSLNEVLPPFPAPDQDPALAPDAAPAIGNGSATGANQASASDDAALAPDPIPSTSADTASKAGGGIATDTETAAPASASVHGAASPQAALGSSTAQVAPPTASDAQLPLPAPSAPSVNPAPAAGAASAQASGADPQPDAAPAASADTPTRNAGNLGGLPSTQPNSTIAGVSPGQILSLAGPSYSTNFTNKPDCSVAAGISTVVAVENASMQWYTKDGTLLNNQTLDSFFNLPSNVTIRDSRVEYDSFNNRFVVLSDAFNGQNSVGNQSFIALAVSKDSNPADGWNFGIINTSLTINGGSTWADYPGLATDGKAIYVTAAMRSFFPFGVPNPNDQFVESHLWIINNGLGTGGLYDGGPMQVSNFNANTVTGGTSSYFGQPAQIQSPTPGATGTFLVNPSSYAGAVQIIRIDNPTISPSFSFQSVIGVSSAGGTEVQTSQPGTSATLLSSATGNAVWLNGILYVASAVQPLAGPDNGVPTVQWERISGANVAGMTLIDQGNISGSALAGPGTATFNPTISADAEGDFLVNFAASGPNLYAGSYYALHSSNDPIGAMEASQALHAGTDQLVVPDANGDTLWGNYNGSVDPVVGNAFWLFNEYAAPRGPGQTGNWGTQLGEVALAARPPAVASGINPLFQNINSGDTGYWLISNGVSAGWVDLGGGNSAYQVAGAADLNGNGTTDILFQNIFSGDTGYWLMNNGAPTGWVDLGGSNNSFRVVGTGDLSGNGTADILFQNVNSGDAGYWSMSNGVSAGWVDLGGSNNTFRIVGTGDFNGNGSTDILFQNINTGDVGYWSMSNGVSAGWVDLGGSNNTYNVVGTGDFNGDGTTDILLQNINSGDTGYWRMQNGVSFGFEDLGGSNNAYHVVGSGDFNHDGSRDILYQNVASGDTGYWTLNNGVFANWVDLGGGNGAYHAAGSFG